MTRTFPLLSIAELRQRPKPESLLGPYIPGRALVVPYGPSGHGKSFLALDWGLSIASGCAWFNHPVKQGPVVYVAAEDAENLSSRVDSWLEARHELEPEQFAAIPEAANLTRAVDVDRLIATIAARWPTPALVIIDTLAQSMVGAEENSTKDMGLVVDATKRIRDELPGAATLVVHHSGRNGEHERGSTALYAAANVVLRVARDEADGAIVIENPKQKNAREAEPLKLQLTEVGESCVLTPFEDVAVIAGARRLALETLSSTFGSEPVSATKWLKATTIPERTFYRIKNALVQGGFVTEERRGKRSVYLLADRGQTSLLP